jgi:hypothetical protein
VWFLKVGNNVVKPDIKNFKQKAINILPTDTDLNKVDVWFQDETRIGQQGSITRI